MKSERKVKIQKAKEAFMKSFTFKKFKQISKYRNCKMDDYLSYVEKMEVLAVLLLESYIFEQSHPL